VVRSGRRRRVVADLTGERNVGLVAAMHMTDRTTTHYEICLTVLAVGCGHPTPAGDLAPDALSSLLCLDAHGGSRRRVAPLISAHGTTSSSLEVNGAAHGVCHSAPRTRVGSSVAIRRSIEHRTRARYGASPKHLARRLQTPATSDNRDVPRKERQFRPRAWPRRASRVLGRALRGHPPLRERTPSH